MSVAKNFRIMLKFRKFSSETLHQHTKENEISQMFLKHYVEMFSNYCTLSYSLQMRTKNCCSSQAAGKTQQFLVSVCNLFDSVNWLTIKYFTPFMAHNSKKIWSPCRSADAAQMKPNRWRVFLELRFSSTNTRWPVICQNIVGSK